MDLGLGMGGLDPAAIKAIGDLYQRKAGIQTAQQTADTNLTTIRAGLLPAERAANVGLTAAQAAGVRTNTSLAPGLAQSTIKLQGSQGGLYDQQAIGEGELNKQVRYGTGGFGAASNLPTIGGGFGSSSSLLDPNRRYSLSASGLSPL
jgi:uncharacterized protein YunC (DUF1805 family)